MNKYYQNIVSLICILILMPFVLLIILSNLAMHTISYIISRTIIKADKYDTDKEWKIVTRINDSVNSLMDKY